MENTVKGNINTRKVAFLTADGVDASSVSEMKAALEAKGAIVNIIAPHSGFIKDNAGKNIKVDHSFLTFASVLVDALYIPSGEKSLQMLKQTPKAIHFIDEAFLHCKAIAADGEAQDLIKISYVAKYLKKDGGIPKDKGLIVGNFSDKKKVKEFISAIGQHRFFERENHNKVPA